MKSRKLYAVMSILTVCFIYVYYFLTNIQPGCRMKAAPVQDRMSFINQTTNRMTISHFKDVPDMTLTIRMTAKPGLLFFFFCALLRSLTLYWPSQLSHLGVILDKESELDHKFAKSLRKYQEQLGINMSFFYEPLPQDERVLTAAKPHSRGYNRQLYSSFIMDKFISTPIVALIDTDVKFTTPVTRENILNGNKLRVKGLYMFHHVWLKTWDTFTEKMIGKPMPTDFMTFFPMYIWRDTITNCRNHILKYVNVSTIEEAYIKIGSQLTGSMSPSNIFMTYAFYFEKERYDWHIDIGNGNLKKYNKLHLLPGHELTSVDMIPDLHVALHAKTHHDAENIVNRQAYCAAVDGTVLTVEQKIKQMCEPFKGHVMWVLFEFCNRNKQDHLTTWCKAKNNSCESMIREHYTNTRQLVNKGVYNLDLKKIKVVEEAAKLHAITCRPFL
ncbi:uncharacterized protein LOC126832440 [Patella vulgata]|uniref:uncharacterized protein LOC126832440 n=1 Tax=Patella vulgata TaxID=6465 RepID=UPI0021802D22|nr:uncharacterized protein LOC126832440 [Patella vulgata]